MKTESVIDFPKDGLCKDIWGKAMSVDGMTEEWTLLPEVDEKAKQIFREVCIKLQVSAEAVHITGSITSNSYTRNADIDLHILHKGADDELNKRARNIFEEMKIKSPGLCEHAGHPFEVYIQPNKYQDLMSIGCYDLLEKKWLVGPELKDSSFNPYSEFYEDAQKMSEKLAASIRDIILRCYEKAIVCQKMLKGNDVKLLKKSAAELRASMSKAADIFDSIRQMRKVFSSPQSEEEALKNRSSRKWHIADAAFKLFDKYGYTAILKKLKILQMFSTSDLSLIEEVTGKIIANVKDLIGNEEKLADADQLDEGVKEWLSLAAVCGMLAIPGIMPEDALAAQMKNVPRSQLRVNSPAVKQAMKNATKAPAKAGMSAANIINAVARTIYAEGLSQSTNGQAAIASVIWNRAGGDPANFIKEISRKNKNTWQFTCWRKYSGGWTDDTYIFKLPYLKRGQQPPSQPKEHIVQKGDTLWKIAKMYKTTPDKIASLNKMLDPNKLKIGQKLVVEMPKGGDTIQTKEKKIWDYCLKLATDMYNKTFKSTIGNRNSYMNKAKSEQHNVDTWGKKLDIDIDDHSFGYLPNNDGFRKYKKVPIAAS